VSQRTHKFTLTDGIEYGGKVQKDVVLRELTAGDVIDASAESEKLILTPDGYQLIASPSLVGAANIRKQIMSIGEIQAPVEDKLYRQLTPRDFQIIQNESEIFEEACLALVKKGELGQSGNESEQGNSQADK
jgi:phage FluMu protein gp41